mmetsp:Transcript_2091/g.2989  ORF Transcript_2091/g.2989 Transcript_2091/m.2989 type:complete len:614 (+) Transcript_2091:370-2211(+)|eukprot:CAMPEP_0178918714 /NCGR_PEP_ID=MMETSP0786-20121207/13977_1 /TAXON_ID=186022 /ORGANISM="Thalassionema frauenfeldii, Strain CCMP 1798" /LENGTH=613 /DNA_ID=CAMNT_0020592449 /DNA_START=336 /DNA_END=2177 /DNA_ORIENTATION=-
MKRRGPDLVSRGGSTAEKKEKSKFTKVNLLSKLTPAPSSSEADVEQNDTVNYALLIALYTLQGIPIGLSASIPFLIQQKMQLLTSSVAAASSASAASASSSASASAIAASASRLSYNANAIFALCSWPFSLKLLWAPIVDAVFFKRFGRRKSWVVPVQFLAGILMVGGSNFVERQLGLGSVGEVESQMVKVEGSDIAALSSMNVKGVTAFFFVLYFLMATQDIAVDGWALTMLSKKNRGRGPVMNSIGQNIGYFLSFVGFLALNDAESSETLWRPLFGLKSKPGEGLVSLGGFIKFMGGFMLAITAFVAFFKKESPEESSLIDESDQIGVIGIISKGRKGKNNDEELDSAEIGIRETYHRLWAVCQLPAVRWLFLVLLTYRLPTSLSDNVKFLKAVEFGLSKSTTALLSPTLILPLGIIVPIVGAKVWHGHPLRQFMSAYKIRITIVPLLDILMLAAVKERQSVSRGLYWIAIVASTALQAIVNSLQFNAQMTFFASRVDPSIGGTYMTLLNTAGNLGGTWPASVVMYLVGLLTVPPKCQGVPEVCTGGRDSYVPIQAVLCVLGCTWVFFLGRKVTTLAELPNEAWQTHSEDGNSEENGSEEDGILKQRSKRD